MIALIALAASATDLVSDHMVRVVADGNPVLVYHGDGYCHLPALPGITLPAEPSAISVGGDPTWEEGETRAFTGIVWEDRSAAGGPLVGAAPLRLPREVGQPMADLPALRAAVLARCDPGRLGPERLVLALSAVAPAARQMLLRWTLDHALRTSSCARKQHANLGTLARACGTTGRCADYVTNFESATRGCTD